MGKLDWVKRAFAVFLLCAATAIALPAQTSTTTFARLHSFDKTDGANPYAGLVQATNGNLYGTTNGGGANGFGGIFKITPTGTLTMLYSFCSQAGCTDGEFPYFGALVQATDGNLYGTAAYGGANGEGTVFKISPSGTLTTLYSFCSQDGCTDGATPFGGLIQATDGYFYGTTNYGGGKNNGTVFKISPGGTLITLYSFAGYPTDGAYPQATVVQAADGNIYGTTIEGGAYSYGTVFRITPSGTLTTLYSFCSYSGCTDGQYPSGLIQATDGNFYGTDGGGANGRGTVFKITPIGTLTTLYSFCSQSGCPDGAVPYAGLFQATDGNLYGTTETSANSGGTVFQITPSGTLTTLYGFCSQSGCADGQTSYAGLVQDTNGRLYGTTAHGGANGYGTVFNLSAGLGPFMETLPASGKVGLGVRILGTNLTGATSVTFNGVAAVFHVLSSSFITATVPLGATTGTVQVVTPSGTLSSNVPFRVLP